MRKIFLILIIGALLIGCAYAADSMNDFKFDDSVYSSNYSDSDCEIYFDETNSSGLGIFKYTDTEDDDGNDSDDLIDGIVMTDGDDYLTADDDYKIDKQADNTGNFTDLENGNYGTVELVEVDNEKYVIVFWTKNADELKEFKSMLDEFNKENNIIAIAF